MTPPRGWDEYDRPRSGAAAGRLSFPQPRKGGQMEEKGAFKNQR